MMTDQEEEQEFLTNIVNAENSKNIIKNTPSEVNTAQEWELRIIPIKTQKSTNKDPGFNQSDSNDIELVVHSSNAAIQTDVFVQNYLSLSIDQVMESKIGPSGFYLKYMVAVIFICALFYHQIILVVTFAFETPIYICSTSSKSADTFECTEDQYCHNIYHPVKIQNTFDSYTIEFNLHCNMPQRQ